LPLVDETAPAAGASMPVRVPSAGTGGASSVFSGVKDLPAVARQVAGVGPEKRRLPGDWQLDTDCSGTLSAAFLAARVSRPRQSLVYEDVDLRGL